MEVLTKIEEDRQTCVFNRRSKGREKGGFMRRSKLKAGSFGGKEKVETRGDGLTCVKQYKGDKSSVKEK